VLTLDPPLSLSLSPLTSLRFSLGGAMPADLCQGQGHAHSGSLSYSRPLFTFLLKSFQEKELVYA